MQAVADRQLLDFLTYIQRILSEGDFVATYKYALLIALADLAVERGDDSGEPLSLSLDEFGESFIRRYWRQAKPYVAPGGQPPKVLQQNTGKQATVIRLVSEAQVYAGTLARLQQDQRRWRSLVRDVGRIVREMPLWRLQILGGEVIDHLYEQQPKERQRSVESITLRPGVAYCLRRFHRLVVDLAQGAWLGFIRRLDENCAVLGQTCDLAEFLFGSERASLSAYQPLLLQLQQGRCFYCEGLLRGERGEVDHFIPWALYPADLGHNFVLAHGGCNLDKRDRIAAFEHLERWWRRNDDQRLELDASFTAAGLVADLQASMQITRWAYEQVETNRAKVWRERRDVMVSLDPRWRSLQGTMATVF